MTDFFERSLQHVLKQEGGFIDNPLDRGGPTNFGITQQTLASWRGVPRVSVEDVKNLTAQEASEIYLNRYWNEMKLHRIRSKKVALILFDQGVNRGPETAIKMLQSVLNRYFAEKLLVDGDLGNKTDAAVSRAVFYSESRLCRELLQESLFSYLEIVQKNETQLPFLRGWTTRVFSLWDATA